MKISMTIILPLWIKSGDISKQYKEKWHGWNLIRTALDNGENIIVFDEDIRHSKRCYYAPTKQILWITANTYNSQIQFKCK